MKRDVAPGVVIAAVASAMLLISVAAAAGEKFAVFGGDLTPPQREELGQVFGVDASAKTDTVTTQEMAAALEGTGIPVAPTERASPARL